MIISYTLFTKYCITGSSIYIAGNVINLLKKETAVAGQN